MPKSELQQPILLTIIRKSNGEWVIEASDNRKMGPYLNVSVALKVAALEVVSARKRGLHAEMFTKDDYGSPHMCKLIEAGETTDNCLICENAWATVIRPLPPRCPVWEAVRPA